MRLDQCIGVINAKSAHWCRCWLRD